MSPKAKNITFFSIFAFLSILVLVLGTIFDLQISKAIADLQPGQYFTKNIFAIIGETIGENVLYTLLVCSFAILFYYLKYKPLNKIWLTKTLQGLLGFAATVVSFYCLFNTLEQISNHTLLGIDKYISSTIGIISIVLLSVVITILTFFLFSKISEVNISYLWKWAVCVVILSAISNGIVQASKIVFDRTRYRAMIFEGYTDFQYYNPWYSLKDNTFDSISIYANDFFKSFPSGHTCAAASSFFLVLLPSFFPQTNNKKWKTIFWTFAIIYTILVGASRIIAGAHFFTDVFVGGMIVVVCTLIAKLIIEKLNKKEDKKSIQTKRTAC